MRIRINPPSQDRPIVPGASSARVGPGNSSASSKILAPIPKEELLLIPVSQKVVTGSSSSPGGMIKFTPSAVGNKIVTTTAKGTTLTGKILGVVTANRFHAWWSLLERCYFYSQKSSAYLRT